MKRVAARYTPEASRLISKLPPEIKRLVRSAIDTLRANADAGAELSGELAGYQSYRVGRHRIIYRYDETDSCLEIYHVGHRRDVYETLRSLLLERN